MRTCSKCKEAKPDEGFYLTSNGHPRGECKVCVRQRTAERYHRLKSPEWIRTQSLRRRYGITADDYERMRSEQGNACAICRRVTAQTSRGETLCVDHDHSTGEVRGLLCHRCNYFLGVLEEIEFDTSKFKDYLCRKM